MSGGKIFGGKINLKLLIVDEPSVWWRVWEFWSLMSLIKNFKNGHYISLPFRLCNERDTAREIQIVWLWNNNSVSRFDVQAILAENILSSSEYRVEAHVRAAHNVVYCLHVCFASPVWEMLFTQLYLEFREMQKQTNYTCLD